MKTKLSLLFLTVAAFQASAQDFVLNQLKSGQVFITCCETDRLTRLGQALTIQNGGIGGE